MTRRASPASRIAVSSRSRSVCRLNDRLAFFRPSPLSTAETSRTWARSAPVADRRGTTVSPASSSALSMTTLPRGARSSSQGQGPPVETAAASAAASWLLPRPGSPAMSVSLPSATRPGHSHSIERISTSAARWTTRARPCAPSSGVPSLWPAGRCGGRAGCAGSPSFARADEPGSGRVSGACTSEELPRWPLASLASAARTWSRQRIGSSPARLRTRKPSGPPGSSLIASDRSPGPRPGPGTKAPPSWRSPPHACANV